MLSASHVSEDVGPPMPTFVPRELIEWMEDRQSDTQGPNPQILESVFSKIFRKSRLNGWVLNGFVADLTMSLPTSIAVATICAEPQQWQFEQQVFIIELLRGLI